MIMDNRTVKERIKMARTKKQEVDLSVEVEEVVGKKHQRKTITISLEEDTIDYFKMTANKLGVPYQTLIHLCLNDIRDRELVPQLHWESKKEA